jgi:hypothetical protein
MGRNCKNKAPKVEIKTQIIDNVMVIPNQTAPPYTMEEVLKIKNYLEDKQDPNGHQLIIDFTEKYFGEVIVGYCNITCIQKTRSRIELALERLNEWEQLNK